MRTGGLTGLQKQDDSLTARHDGRGEAVIKDRGTDGDGRTVCRNASAQGGGAAGGRVPSEDRQAEPSG